MAACPEHQSQWRALVLSGRRGWHDRAPARQYRRVLLGARPSGLAGGLGLCGHQGCTDRVRQKRGKGNRSPSRALQSDRAGRDRHAAIPHRKCRRRPCALARLDRRRRARGCGRTADVPVVGCCHNDGITCQPRFCLPGARRMTGTSTMKPIIIVGAGPVGLTTALGLDFYGLPFQIFEEDDTLSLDTKAGTILTRTLEAFRRYGVADGVLAKALRVDEIGGLDRATSTPTLSVRTELLVDETRYPFVINLPQHHLEPVLRERLDRKRPGALHLRHRLQSFRQNGHGVVATFDTPAGPREVEGSYLLACDGGRSTVRTQLDIPVEGVSHDIRYMLVDLKVDLDIANPRDYPYLAYFSDPQEWMILVRQPHCWRFLFPLPPDAEPPSNDALREKVRRFIGDVDTLEVLNSIVYRVHHRIATEWRRDRVFLMGDAAHLITPMWALGLNTGILDAIGLPWRLAWVARGWASDALLDGYAREQRPVAAEGSGEMALAA